MKYYSAYIRPAGDLHTEVHKDNLSAPEVMLLRHLHGVDAVLKVQYIGDKNTKHKAERERLAMAYGGNEERGKALLREIFGSDMSPLPLELEDVQPEPLLDDEDDNEQVVDKKDPEPVLPAPKATKAA